MVAIAPLEYENLFAAIPIFVAVQGNKVLIAYVVDDAPDLKSRLGKDIGGAALAQPRVTRDGEAIVGQTGYAEELRGRAATLHLLPIHVRTVGEVIQARISF